MFLSLAGEGGQAGRVTVFVRFSGCNLWSGREEDRSSAQCPFCDTDFKGSDGPFGGRHCGSKMVELALELWGDRKGKPYVVFTGGEPSLQLDESLIRAFSVAGFETGIETNGTLPLPEGLDWVCVSPKGTAKVVVKSGQELKLVYPQEGVDPKDFLDLDFEYYFLQPLFTENKKEWFGVVDYCLEHPDWRLSLQNHKVLGVP